MMNSQQVGYRIQLHIPILILMAKMYTLKMPTYILLPNLIVEHSALSMGVGGNLTVTPNKDMISTSKNDTDKSTDMADDSIYIIISYAAQEP